ncbi:hypothetical protein ABID47_001195 [Paenibacillus favisporus]|uniref:Uncharacterized protein n=1 Tax=Paenibacillus favisporus TaxID=221028 RepID=A0ABV2EYI8_9BACL
MEAPHDNNREGLAYYSCYFRKLFFSRDYCNGAEIIAFRLSSGSLSMPQKTAV